MIILFHFREDWKNINDKVPFLSLKRGLSKKKVITDIIYIVHLEFASVMG